MPYTDNAQPIVAWAYRSVCVAVHCDATNGHTGKERSEKKWSGEWKPSLFQQYLNIVLWHWMPICKCFKGIRADAVSLSVEPCHLYFTLHQNLQKSLPLVNSRAPFGTHSCQKRLSPLTSTIPAQKLITDSVRVAWVFQKFAIQLSLRAREREKERKAKRGWFYGNGNTQTKQTEHESGCKELFPGLFPSKWKTIAQTHTHKYLWEQTQVKNIPMPIHYWHRMGNNNILLVFALRRLLHHLFGFFFLILFWTFKHSANSVCA